MSRHHATSSASFLTHVSMIILSALIVAVVVPPAPGQPEPAAPMQKGLGASSSAARQVGSAIAPPSRAAGEQSAVKPGLSINDPKAYQGLTLVAPMDGGTTYLIDMQGRVVHTWETDSGPALCPYLLENGHLLRAGSIGNDSRIFGPGPGVGGRIQEFTWTGELVWDFRYYSARHLPHHDITRLPNGNVLLVVSDRKTNEEILAAGRRPELAGELHSIPDCLIEIKPTGKTTGEVVWEWHVSDHLVQDFDKTKANYGDVAQHPELINVNYGEDDLKPSDARPPASALAGAAVAAKMNPDKPITPAPARPGAPPRGNSDWTHFNAVAYNADLDQVVVSVYAISEFWIIDHSTTREEAAGHTGGKSGKGGDLLYRWGNPRAYRAGKKTDQTLFNQHNVHWIPKGLPGEGHLLLFNNGNGRSDGNYSSVDELILPNDPQGHYPRLPGGAFASPQIVWSYTAPKKTDFYSSFISGAQRLPNGDTFICSGASGTVFEVTPAKEVVWKYVNPARRSSGFIGPTVPPGTVMSPIVRDLLDLSNDQRRQLDEVQKKVAAQIPKMLTAEQQKQLAEPSQNRFGRPGELLAGADQTRIKLTVDQQKTLATLQKEVDDQLEHVLNAAQKKQLKGSNPGGGAVIQAAATGVLNQLKNLFGGVSTPPPVPAVVGPVAPAPAGKILSPSQQQALKLTPDQIQRLQEMQKDIDSKLEMLLTVEQKTVLKQIQQTPTSPTPTVVAAGGPRGNPLFRAYRFGLQHPAVVGKQLVPGKTIEEMQQPAEKK